MTSDSRRARHAPKSWRVALVALAFATAAGAQEVDDRTRAAARQLAQDGAAAFERGEFEKARALLRRASSLYPAPTITLMEARALAKLGRLVEAAERYEDARRSKLQSDASSAFEEAIAAADEEVTKLRPKIPLLTIVVQNTGEAVENVEVLLNGRAVPVALLGVRQPVDPGKHEVLIKRGGRVVGKRSLSVAEGSAETVTLDAAGAVLTEGGVQESGASTWAWVALGAGGVGLVTGVAAGLVMQDKKSSLDDVCTPTCPPSSQDDLDGFRSARTVSFVGYGVGIVGVGVGATLLLMSSGKTEASRKAPRLAPRVGLGQIGLQGSF